jgi:hypothetical protein
MVSDLDGVICGRESDTGLFGLSFQTKEVVDLAV